MGASCDEAVVGFDFYRDYSGVANFAVGGGQNNGIRRVHFMMTLLNIISSILLWMMMISIKIIPAAASIAARVVARSFLHAVR